MYRRLSRHANPRIRAEALLRLGRVLRKYQDLEAAMEAYRSLARSGVSLQAGCRRSWSGLTVSG